jgi:hypothetical protein
MNRADPKQSTRVVILLIYLAVLLGAGMIADGKLPPTLGGKGLWFYTGVVSLILGNLLITPFYTTPKDALANVFLSATALYAVNQWSVWEAPDKLAFAATIAYFLSIAFAAFGAIILKDSTLARTQQFGDTLRIVCEELGNQRLVFSSVILFSIFAFHRSSARETLVITLAWTVTVALKPDQTMFKLSQRFRRVWKASAVSSLVGHLLACQTPGIILIRQDGGDRVPFGTPLLVNDPHESPKLAIALDYVGRDQGLLLRAIEFEQGEQVVANAGVFLDSIPPSGVARLSDQNLRSLGPDLTGLYSDRERFVGIVAPDTSVEKLFFEVIRESDLHEGRLVQVSIADKEVLYQVIDGLTREEIIYQKNTFGFARGQARKIGVWDSEERRFRRAKWLPQPNTAVYLKITDTLTPDPKTIGHFPGTSYPVGLKNIDHLVTHNTAVLGVLGIGKSMLAIELVERMIAHGIKVICLDLTNQYAAELSDFYNASAEARKLQLIRDAGEAASDGWQEDPEKGGSIPALRQAILKDLREFLDTDNPHRLKIYNPAEIVATKQLRDPKTFMVDGQWERRASLWTITPVEVTSIVAEVALGLTQDEMSDRARVCLVLEEAHSLVPEFGTVASEGDNAATNRTARAILQGRKYGFGCLLITQRTANVTKTILNQCNSIFAMRTFDETGKEFLSNYIGKDYSGILPSLEERHAVFFGKASTCENPVLIRLNDQKDFRAVFREAYPPTPLPRKETIDLASTTGSAEAIISSGVAAGAS